MSLPSAFPPAARAIRRAARRAALVAALLVVAACAGGGAADADSGRAGAARGQATPAADTAAPRDDYGRPVALGRTPRRIVSLGPVTTEVLFTMGVGDRVVGRSKWDTWPAAALAVPDVGDALLPNVERVVALRPDLVVLYGSAGNRGMADRLAALGIATLAVRMDHIEQFVDGTRLLGRAIGEPARAEAVVDSVQATLARVRAATTAAIAAGAPRPRVLWPLVGTPLYVIGGGSFLSELVTIAGGTNVFGDDARPSPEVSREALLARDADVVLVGPQGAAKIAADPAWRGLRAVRDGRVLVYDTTLVLRPSVQLGSSAVGIARMLHPGLLDAHGAPLAPVARVAAPAPAGR